MAQLCKSIGLAIDNIKKLFAGESISFTGNLCSAEHDQDFSVQDARLQIFKEQNTPDKYRLSLNGQNIIDWFRLRFQELKQSTRPHIKPKMSESKGVKR